ncbi:class I SAM-dependent methyltransferase [Helicobacter sp. MIT 21-1697]|uniref:class I SAM-dependent methyltransferase n=1 Tax=Helicobacter sp. MIT 21-1697 TaxID=2993733 RepID=UPI00224B335A|nr:class I SAM-dependent methyltransferase [Helicobacter sp. MIT 21-1697]MCX2716484.1 class I SAM-dependent methyltransferase [Helicobacter sp. MIT 21-1697]
MKFLRKLKDEFKRHLTKPFKVAIPQEYAKDLQQWNNDRGVFSTSYQAICAVIRQNSQKTPLFYLTSKFWNLQSVIPARFKEQKAFIESAFLPKLKKSDCLLDMGCANGEWSFMFAPFVKEVRAYDYSPALIEGAKEIHARDFPHISNITFAQGDASSLKGEQTYDCIALMGVLSYVFKWQEAEEIFSKLHTALRGGGGYMIYKDNTNSSAEDFYFYANRNYWMVARSRAKYLALFEKVGFKIVQEKIIHKAIEKLENEQIETESYMCILQKE